jgi:hypothetical protein
MFTRKQYLDKECTHDQYYAQFVTHGVIHLVSAYIGEARIKKSTCPHFTDIPLCEWDGIAPRLSVGERLRECGDYPTLAGKVCILKAAANQIRF